VASWPALAPVSEDVNGCRGLHQTSVETPSALPMASMNEGNSSALPTEAILGRYSRSAACCQKVAKSGGSGTPVTMSAPAALNFSISVAKLLFSPG
jgi:hypothetical protein